MAREMLEVSQISRTLRVGSARSASAIRRFFSSMLLALAAASPAEVLSLMMSLSNSARAAKRWKTSLPSPTSTTPPRPLNEAYSIKNSVENTGMRR